MRRYTVLLYPEEGGYSVLVPALNNLATQGDTVEEALAMARDAIEGYVRRLTEDGDYIPTEETPPMVVSIEAVVAEPATA